MTKLKCLLLILIFLPSFSFAQGTNIALGGLDVDATAAIEIASDNLAIDQATGRAEFNGNVVIGQGALRLSANKVLVTYNADGSEISKLEAFGGVTFVTATDAAEANSAIYSLQNETIVLTGDVLLTQGASAISANEMVINLKTETAQMNGRVRTILQQSGN